MSDAATQPARASATAHAPFAGDGWRTWGSRALLAYGMALGIASAAAIPVLVSGIGALGSSPRVGAAVLQLLTFLLVAVLLGAVGARAIQLGRSLAHAPGATRPGAIVPKSVQTLSALAGALGILHLVAGHEVLLGLLGLAAGILGAMATGAWASHAPGSAARASALGLLASLLYLGTTLHAGNAYVPPSDASGAVAAMLRAVLPPGAAVAVAAAAVLAWAALARTANRTLATAVVGLAGLLAGVQLLVHGLDFAAADWPALEAAPTTLVAALVLGYVSVLTALAAAALAILAAGLLLSRHLPDLVSRAGAGFLAPEPGAACARCGLLPPYHARFCPDCGEALRRNAPG